MAATGVAQTSEREAGHPARRRVVRGLLAASILVGVLAPAATSWATPLMGC